MNICLCDLREVYWLSRELLVYQKGFGFVRSLDWSQRLRSCYKVTVYTQILLVVSIFVTFNFRVTGLGFFFFDNRERLSAPTLPSGLRSNDSHWQVCEILRPIPCSFELLFSSRMWIFDRKFIISHDLGSVFKTKSDFKVLNFSVSMFRINKFLQFCKAFLSYTVRHNTSTPFNPLQPSGHYMYRQV